MIPPPKRWQLWLPLALGLADLGWACSALNPMAAANQVSTVGLINTVVWIYLHLPAVILASLPFGGSQAASAASLPQGEQLALVAAGVLETAALAWWLGRMIDRKGDA